MEDEASFHRQPTAAKLWAPEGRTQPHLMRSRHSNSAAVRAAAAFDPARGRLVHCLRAHFRAPTLAGFYRQIGTAFASMRRICLVMDNWPVHSHPKAWQAIAEDSRLQILWLPTYAPWLNPTEKLWKWLRQRFTHAHPLADNLAQLRAGIDRHLTYAAQHPQEILRYTGTGNDKLYST